jgi:hypothetical protein
MKDPRRPISANSGPKRVAIVQSNYIPWKGYFDLIQQVDEFILFDDVQYTRRDWRNRNRIKGKDGVKWLTVPVNAKGNYVEKIKNITVSDPTWSATHWKTIQHSYGKAPYFHRYYDVFKELYASAGSLKRLSDVNFHFLGAICRLLGISTRLTWSMDYSVGDGRTERLVSLCRQAGASEYISGPSAKDYVEVEQFENAGIRLTWMDYSGYPQYRQLSPPFEHSVSVLDLIFNTGDEARAYLAHEECSP